MAPLKFEEKIKEKLEQRAIEPSAGSWKRLETQLEQPYTRKKGYKTIWYSVAAIFIGVLILTFVFKSQNTVSGNRDSQFVDKTEEIKEKDNIEVVLEKDIPNEVATEKHQTPINDGTKEEAIAGSNAEEGNTVHNNNPISKDEEYRNQINTGVAEKVKDTFKVLEPKQEIVKTVVREDVLAINEIVEGKVANVVAQIQELKKNKTEVTEEEINMLLLNAQREITSQNIFKTNTVNASALLQEVESEVDETFKQRVFEALKTSFQKVKTAVAEREN